MSAEPIPASPGPWCPDPMRQQRADYTLEDLLTLPDDAPRSARAASGSTNWWTTAAR
ncbi:hypothetical protein M8C11_09725 [Micromonospora sp. CPM1]|uniref:hypothetical protein n=1 Tax=Micromonospora TaxID=1873 RepID=UPI00207C3078|nr:hypothetical protein [Micromonospora sp. CPM1]MCO1614995.1 hypothetical protein [Micromonospora sp. CPM1]